MNGIEKRRLEIEVIQNYVKRSNALLSLGDNIY